MTTTNAPLLSDAAILDHVGGLLGPATGRRLWCFFLTGDSRMCPAAMPIEELPIRPVRGEMGRFGLFLAMQAAQAHGESFLPVWERPGGSALTALDSLWLRAISDACTRSGLAVRLALLSHDDGVRAVRPEEYGF